MRTQGQDLSGSWVLSPYAQSKPPANYQWTSIKSPLQIIHPALDLPGKARDLPCAPKVLIHCPGAPQSSAPVHRPHSAMHTVPHMQLQLLTQRQYSPFPLAWCTNWMHSLCVHTIGPHTMMMSTSLPPTCPSHQQRSAVQCFLAHPLPPDQPQHPAADPQLPGG
jgi:hypothetical protein